MFTCKPILSSQPMPTQPRHWIGPPGCSLPKSGLSHCFAYTQAGNKLPHLPHWIGVAGEGGGFHKHVGQDWEAELDLGRGDVPRVPNACKGEPLLFRPQSTHGLFWLGGASSYEISVVLRHYRRERIFLIREFYSPPVENSRLARHHPAIPWGWGSSDWPRTACTSAPLVPFSCLARFTLILF